MCSCPARISSTARYALLSIDSTVQIWNHQLQTSDIQDAAERSPDALPYTTTDISTTIFGPYLTWRTGKDEETTRFLVRELARAIILEQ